MFLSHSLILIIKYVAIEMSGYSDERYWNVENLKLESYSPHECTVLIPVSWEPNNEEIIAPLTFSFIDNHIIIGMNYFATRN